MTGAAHVVEVFSSIQGEGMLVGCRQVFVRFCGCNLVCPYCDTPESRCEQTTCRIEATPGERDFVPVKNPLCRDELVAFIDRLMTARHHSISFTGGEPLIYADFLTELLPELKRRNRRIYLETNGTLPGALAQVLPWTDIIAMDIKLLPGESTRYFPAHAAFLAGARARDVFVKIVVLPDTTVEEVLAAARLVADVDVRIPVILQPVTPAGAILSAPGPGQMLRLQAAVLEALEDVRVIPQTHKFIGQL